jgi:hypothetical protein
MTKSSKIDIMQVDGNYDLDHVQMHTFVCEVLLPISHISYRLLPTAHLW